MYPEGEHGLRIEARARHGDYVEPRGGCSESALQAVKEALPCGPFQLLRAEYLEAL
jgi:hypothetical protein